MAKLQKDTIYPRLTPCPYSDFYNHVDSVLQTLQDWQKRIDLGIIFPESEYQNRLATVNTESDRFRQSSIESLNIRWQTCCLMVADADQLLTRSIAYIFGRFDQILADFKSQYFSKQDFIKYLLAYKACIAADKDLGFSHCDLPELGSIEKLIEKEIK
ncbi:MAG: hypothetical protein ABIX01_11870 [Chitinophagaceae bacterium]